MIARRTRLAAVALAVAAVATPVLSTGAASAAAAIPPKVKVPTGTVLNVADQVEGLETALSVSGQNTFPFTVNYSSFLGAPAVFQAFQSGDVDLSIVGDSTLIAPQVAGQSFYAIAAYVDPNTGFGLLAAPGSTVTAITKKQIEGKKIGLEFGTNAQSYVLLLLKKLGLTTSQVDLVNLPETSYVTAVKSAAVDFIVSESPLTQSYEAEVPGGKFFPTPNVATGREWLVATKAAVDNPAKSAAIASYLEHYTAALVYINKHEEQYLEAYYVGVNKLPATIVPTLLQGLKPSYTVPINSSLIAQQQELTNLFTQAGFNAKLNVSKIITNKYNKYIVAGLQSSQS